MNKAPYCFRKHNALTDARLAIVRVIVSLVAHAAVGARLVDTHSRGRSTRIGRTVAFVDI